MAQISFGRDCFFAVEKEAYEGVKKVAHQVMDDIALVTGKRPGEYRDAAACENLVLCATIGHSPLLERLQREERLDLSAVRGKWEVYSFQVLDGAFAGARHVLVIAGSDKRGTIYGMYHLSELLGVSPFVNWNHVRPKKDPRAMLTDKVNMVSNEPSVRYRGFFINDEWPAFGTWAEKHFGGINAACYERVFELLLRLKGNYLWPAMWSSNFSMDGPGIESARLADEYGVVMSTSHHEPCMRSGEEYTLVRGKDSVYGDAWNFRTNREGIERFWKDGLLRNRDFENVITLGMRGERDTAILGKEAGLQANIDLLRDVLHTQNQLIRENVCEDLDKVPRQIVLFTEVEEFFYGNEKVKGLQGDPELDGVTLMFSDNNFGYTRTLPTKELREHKGGCGMYYHMDMHGGAYSYQWVGSSYLPRIWEQMTQAYEFGVRKIWVTNIGDIGTQEYGLSYFLDLAYDIHKWGGEDAQVTVRYTKEWTARQFGAYLPDQALRKMNRAVWDYTGMLAKRRHEIMNEDVYHPLHNGEAQEILDTSERVLRTCEFLKNLCPKRDLSAFISLFYYPACGTANLMKMWILTGLNRLYARQSRMEANLLARRIEECMRRDRELTREYHTVDGGYYDGFGSTEHIGFTNWNDEDNKFPIRSLVFPANRPRMLLAKEDDERYMTGLEWTDRPQTWEDALRPDVEKIVFTLANASDIPYAYEIRTDHPWMRFSKVRGKVKVTERITLHIDRAHFKGAVSGTFTVTAKECAAVKKHAAKGKAVADRNCADKETDAAGKERAVIYGRTTVTVLAENREAPEGVFLESGGTIAMDARHYFALGEAENGAFKLLSPYGRSGSALKAYPVTTDFTREKEKPRAEFRFLSAEGGAYGLTFYLAPATPVTPQSRQEISYSLNRGEICTVNTVEDPSAPFFLSAQWGREARDNIKKVTVKAVCEKGVNRLFFYAASPGIVLERIVLVKERCALPQSYLGPRESCLKLPNGKR